MANIRDTVRDYKPTKTVWAWSCVGAAVATIVVGFTLGGWVTGGHAREMAQEGAQDARAELAASVCVNRFLDAPDARVNFAALQEESSFSQDDYLEDGGWTTFGESEDPIEGAASLCADQLAEAEMSPEPAPVAEAEPVAQEAPVAQADADAGSSSPVTDADETDAATGEDAEAS